MPLAQDFTRANNRAITVRDTVTIKFTIKDANNNPVNLSLVTAMNLHVKLDPTTDPLITLALGSGLTIDPDQTNNTGVVRAKFTGGASGQTDREEGIHFYDGLYVLGGEPFYFVAPQSRMEFVDVITKV